MISVNPKSNKWRPNNMNPIMSENTTSKTQTINEHGEVVENGVVLGKAGNPGPCGPRGCMSDECTREYINRIITSVNCIGDKLDYYQKCDVDETISRVLDELECLHRRLRLWRDRNE